MCVNALRERREREGGREGGRKREGGSLLCHSKRYIKIKGNIQLIGLNLY